MRKDSGWAKTPERRRAGYREDRRFLKLAAERGAAETKPLRQLRVICASVEMPNRAFLAHSFETGETAVILTRAEKP